MAYALTAAGSLLAFDTASPTTTTAITLTGVDTNETLVGIDYRPQNGQLYALGVNATANTASVYLVSPRTGTATPILASGIGGAGNPFTTDGTTPVDLPDPATVGYGFDFNPAVDRIRVVAGSLTFRANPNTGTAVDGDNGGAAGSVTGVNPDGPINGGTTTLDGAAYTNNVPNNGAVTTLYTLDGASNSIYIQNPPNSGTQTNPIAVTLNGNPLDFTVVSGFDIAAGVNAPASNAPVATGSALAVLSVGGTTSLYSINLVNGQATLVGAVGNGTTAIQGFAINNDLGGVPAIAMSADGTSLLRFNTASAGTVTTQALNLANVVAGEVLVGLDIRPQTGQLYALGINATANTGTLYLVDPQTGAVTIAVAGTASAITFAGVDFPDPTTIGYGIDFNPTVDRIRVVTGSGLNFRINPNTGLPAAATVDGAITGLPAGSTGVSATAYTNSFGQPLTGGVTTQYTLDATSNSLFIQNPPNNGTQTAQLPITLNGNPLDFTEISGFDIPAGVTVATSNTPQSVAQGGRGFAALTVGGTTNMYSINLATGVATLLGPIGAGATPTTGFTLADAPAGTINFSAPTFAVTENGGTLTITATRTGGTTGSVSVTLDATGGTAVAGTDFTGTPATLVFADGSATATATITITDNMVNGGNKTINLALSAPTNGAVLGATPTSVVTIVENEGTPAAVAGVSYALTAAGALLAFDAASPTTTTTIALTGVDANETLVGIDIRPQNGMLYGLGVNATANTATLYAISVRTGVATPVGAVGSIAYVTAGGAAVDLPDPATVGYGFDFNPAVDRIRIVAGSLNARANPNNGLPVDGDAVNAGIQADGPISGATTTVDGAAYTNNTPNNGGITTLYHLDAASNSLFIQNPPNVGTTTNAIPITLNGNPLDFTVVNGFDIVAGVNAPTSNAPVATGSALAVLTVGGTTSLYSINLVNGQAMLVGAVGNGMTGILGFATNSNLGGIPAIAMNAAGTSLLRFNTASAGTVTTQALNLTALVAGEVLVGLDIRPQTGQLYALGINATTNTGTLYLVDPQTGAVSIAVAGTASAITFAGADFPDPATIGYGIDFNPTVDRIRVVTGSGLNFRINPITGLPAAATVDGAITGLPAGSTGVSATAYTNSFGQSLTGGVTTQYTLDATSNSLFIQNPPNNGTQTAQLQVTLNGAPLDFTEISGFDIPAGVTVATSNTPQSALQGGRGFAALTVGGTTNMYSINLATGVATLLGPIGAGATPTTGFTLADAPAGTVNFSAPTFAVTENGGTLTITATRTGGTTGSVSVTVNVTGGTAVAGTDFTGTPATLVFADGSATASVSIPITDNALAGGNKTINLALSAPTNGAVLGATATAVATIVENEGAPAIVSGVAYALSGTSLIAFDPLNPAAANAPLAITGIAAGETIVGVDFRPQNGLLYGLGYNATTGTVQLYAISTNNGVATAVGTAGQFVNAAGTNVRVGVDANTSFGFDFNPAVDRIRVVTSNGQTFRMNPNTGGFVDGDLGGAMNSVMNTNMDGPISGGTTTVDGAAYTNNVANTAITTLYTLDATTNRIFIQNPPNSGTQSVGRLVTLNGAPLDFTAVSGFDIQPGVNAIANNAPAAGSAVAVLTVGGVARLYSIDLTSGAATLLGPVGAGTAAITGLAFQGNAVANGTPAIGLNTAGTALVRFNTATPATSTNVNITLNGVMGVTPGETLVGLDFRPATGQYYALGISTANNNGTLYLIDPQTGAATIVGTMAGLINFVDAAGNAVPLPNPATVGYGFDFNPAVDRIRVVTGNGLNFRINPIDGTPVDGNLGMTAGTLPAGVNTDGAINGLPAGSTGVTATAYTNSFSQTGVATPVTTQYTLDATSNSLFIQNPPNAGTQTSQVAITLNGAPLDFTAINGFDIPSNVKAAASNTAVPSGIGFATLVVGGVSNLYSINLVTGAATLLGTSPGGGLSGISVAQTPAGSVSFATGSFTVNENAGTATINLVRTGGSSGQMTVQVVLTNGTATGGTDFTPTTITVTFADGATTATATIPITDDMLVEGAFETVNLALAGATGGVIGQTSTASLSITDNDMIAQPVNQNLTVTGSGAGIPGTVTAYNPDGSVRFTIQPYGGFSGGVDTATGDVNGDGVIDIITGAGSGGGPHIKVFDGSTGAELQSFFAFISTFTGGVSVAALDFDGNGTTDIVVAAGAGGGPHIKVFDFATNTELASFFAYGTNFSGGVSIATGDVTGDGVADLITGALNGPAHVKVFQGGVSMLTEVRSFFAFPPNLLTGVNVTASNGMIFAAPASNSDSTVRVYSQGDDVNFQSFNPYPGFNGGVRIATNDVGQIVTGAGPGGGPNVKVFDPITFAELNSFFALDPTFTGGVFVG